MDTRRLLGKICLLTFFAATLLPASSFAQNQNHAGLVIQFDEGQVETRCVSFSESQITGFDLLQRAGLDIVIDVDGAGTAVCAINGSGCPADDCFCQCSGADCLYWSYWHLNGGSWNYSQGGAALYPIEDGAVDGWVWGAGSVTEAQPPPQIQFEAICQQQASSSTETPPPTATFAPTATFVPPTPAPEINFWADKTTINAGSCATIYWDVRHVNAVYFEGAGVDGQGGKQVCPSSDATYSLQATHGGQVTERQVTIKVIPGATATAQPTNAPPSPIIIQMSPTPLPPATSTPNWAATNQALPSPTSLPATTLTQPTPTFIPPTPRSIAQISPTQPPPSATRQIAQLPTAISTEMPTALPLPATATLAWQIAPLLPTSTAAIVVVPSIAPSPNPIAPPPQPPTDRFEYAAFAGISLFLLAALWRSARP